MSNQISVTQYIDLDKFVKAVKDNATLKTGRVAEAFAKRYVQVDNGTLRDSISFDGVDSITATAQYAAVQEYGRPGNYQLDPNRVVNFGYTPYLRPAASDAANAVEKSAKLMDDIVSAALRVSRRPGV